MNWYWHLNRHFHLNWHLLSTPVLLHYFKPTISLIFHSLFSAFCLFGLSYLALLCLRKLWIPLPSVDLFPPNEVVELNYASVSAMPDDSLLVFIIL